MDAQMFSKAKQSDHSQVREQPFPHCPDLVPNYGVLHGEPAAMTVLSLDIIKVNYTAPFSFALLQPLRFCQGWLYFFLYHCCVLFNKRSFNFWCDM